MEARVARAEQDRHANSRRRGGRLRCGRLLTIVEGIVIPGWFLEPLGESLHEAGYHVAYAVLRAPLAVCASRARSRESQPLSDREVLARLWHDFADLGPLEPNGIEIGARSPAEAANLLAQRLEDGLLAT